MRIVIEFMFIVILALILYGVTLKVVGLTIKDKIKKEEEIKK